MGMVVYNKDNNVLMIKQNEWLIFEPKKDITAYEVNLLLNYFISHLIPGGNDSKALSCNISRHFTKEK